MKALRNFQEIVGGEEYFSVKPCYHIRQLFWFILLNQWPGRAHAMKME